MELSFKPERDINLIDKLRGKLLFCLSKIDDFIFLFNITGFWGLAFAKR
jgi:hypothetical protein